MGPHYRPRMKDLRRRAFAMQQSWGTHLPLGPPCSATSVAGILVTAAQALTEAHKERPRKKKPTNPAGQCPRDQDRQISPRTGERGGVAVARRPRRQLSPHRDV